MPSISSSGSRCDLVPGRTLFDYADDLDIPVPTSCRRSARCHECIVEVTRGMEMLSPAEEVEGFLRGNFRLACQAMIERVTADVEFAPIQRRTRILTRTHTPDVGIQFDPVVTHSGGRVWYDDLAIDHYAGRLLGLAIDLGTTTIVVDLVDLNTAETIGQASFENPQRFGGSDVMSRISYDSSVGGSRLHKAVVRTLNFHLSEMYKALAVDRRHVYEAIVVGNTTMRDLFFNLNVESIGQKPYRSLVEHEYRSGHRKSTAILELASCLGVLMHPDGRVFGAPLLGSHVGADIAADLLAINACASDETMMLVDIGTNTEIVVAHGGQVVAASCPAGPAFESGVVKYGMTAANGAIEALRFHDGAWHFSTIAGERPRGICGSGLIDLLAELRRHDIMTAKGVFPNRAREMTIVPEEGITFSRDDMSQLAQAKAANYCGQLIAMRAAGIQPEDIDRLYLAGGFANYVDVQNAIEIGFLAPVPEASVIRVGNASLAGAKQMLLSKTKRQAIDAFVQRIAHIELETTHDFFEIFVDACQFKPMPRRFAK